MSFRRRCLHAFAALVSAGLAALCSVANARVEPVGLPFHVELGPREVVFDWAHDRCAPLDIPDEPLRVFRRADGTLIGIASHSTSRLFTISAAGGFIRRCEPVMESARDRDPAAFRYETWIASPWTEDGRNVFALADNEFQGEEVAGACRFSTYYQCWFNSLILLGSTDGGEHFAPLPGPPVAAAAFDHRAMPGKPRGFFGPSNIFNGGDGFSYAVAYTTGGGDQPAGTCLFRAHQPGRWLDWEYWTADGFVPSAYDPYREAGGRKPCLPIKGLPGRVSSIVRIGNLFVAVFAAQGADQDRGKIGITVSGDLLHWSPYEIVLRPQMIWSRVCNEPRYAYPSIVDLTSSDRNFGTIAGNAYLYLTEAVVRGCALTAERNLVRYRLVLGSAGEPAPIN